MGICREVARFGAGQEPGGALSRSGCLCCDAKIHRWMPENCKHNTGLCHLLRWMSLQLQLGRPCGTSLTWVLFSFSSSGKPRLPGRLSVMPQRALCAVLALSHPPQTSPAAPVPCRGSGKSCHFLFYNITWFCKCCFLFQYLYFLLFEVR